MAKDGRTVLIVGAGPTGLTAGLELARLGVRVEIIDRREGGSTLSRAVGINPRSLHLLEASGVTSRLLHEAVPIRSVQFFRQELAWATVPLTSARIRYGRNQILGLPQDRTESILRDAFLAAGGRLRYGVELARLENGEKRAIAHTSGGEEIPCDFLVGADGIRSTTRDAVGIRSHGYDLDEQWSIADVDLDHWESPTALSLCLMSRGGVAVVVPLGGDRYRLVSNTSEVLTDIEMPLRVTKIRRQSSFKIRVAHVEKYHLGRVFLTGDAAHSHSPVGGRGMNLGIADAADFAACLVEGRLSEYGRRRSQEAAATISGSERMRRLISSPNPVVRSLLLGGLKTASWSRWISARLAGRFLYG